MDSRSDYGGVNVDKQRKMCLVTTMKPVDYIIRDVQGVSSQTWQRQKSVGRLPRYASHLVIQATTGLALPPCDNMSGPCIGVLSYPVETGVRAPELVVVSTAFTYNHGFFLSFLCFCENPSVLQHLSPLISNPSRTQSHLVNRGGPRGRVGRKWVGN
jgi:hypothetical protein